MGHNCFLQFLFSSYSWSIFEIESLVIYEMWKSKLYLLIPCPSRSAVKGLDWNRFHNKTPNKIKFDFFFSFNVTNSLNLPSGQTHNTNNNQQPQHHQQPEPAKVPHVKQPNVRHIPIFVEGKLRERNISSLDRLLGVEPKSPRLHISRISPESW